ncbi:DUF2690 domain-containing protein [Geodermatophilus maliterrae]|uniref:DUF2690 domain-containing protein n=1 Tax=Geodermatophilus maliterrae TaxID=3162531 RepID=A0ABV3XM39_9ACTN
MSAALLVMTSIWGWQARKDLVDRSTPGSVPNRSQRTTWVAVQAVLVLAVVVGASVIFVAGLQPAPSLASAYDTQDPELTMCAGSAQPISGDDPPAVRDDNGHQVGHLELRSSAICGTIWVKIIFEPGENARLIGGQVRIVTNRPADGASAPYLLPIKTDSGFGYGNMLSNAAACVKAEVAVRRPGADEFGPTATTQCH